MNVLVHNPAPLQIKLEPYSPAEEARKEQSTEYFALQKRPSPTAHLSVLQGRQDNIQLLADEYLSPVLHNVPDIYIRHLQSYVQYPHQARAFMDERYLEDREKRRRQAESLI